jgi:hypothetical protein
MKKEWLQEQTTVEDAEREHLVTDERLGPNPVPFGFVNSLWLSFKEQIRRDDQIWKFSSPDQSWEHLAGREGLCLVRDGEVVTSIVTKMN